MKYRSILQRYWSGQANYNSTMIHLIVNLLLTYIGCTHALECNLTLDTCTFSGIRTSATNMYFNASAVNITAVQTVRFADTVMPILTNELCKTFPNMKILRATNTSIEKIAPNALHACKALTEVSFFRNKLEKLDHNTFENNSELEYISIQENNFKSIDSMFYELPKKLKSLILAENYLTYFPIGEFPVVSTLERLDIYANQLTDLDEQEVLHKFPNLKKIFMHNNLFDCDRLRIILNAFRRRGVSVEEWFKHAVTRNTNLPKVGTVECLTLELRVKILMKGLNLSDVSNFGELSGESVKSSTDV